jgi:hypothetical protein
MMTLASDSISLKHGREKLQWRNDVNDTKKEAILRDLLAAADKHQLQGQPNVIQISADNFYKIDYPEFWKDLLVSAEAISTFLYGTPDKARSVYHLVETSNTLPAFRLGSKLAALKSTIRATFWARQRRAFEDQKEGNLVQLGVLLMKLLVLARAAQQDRTNKPGDIHLWMALLAETSRSIDRILMRE